MLHVIIGGVWFIKGGLGPQRSLELPDELVSYVLSFLTGFEAARSAPLVCSSWSHVCNNDKLWRFMYEKEFGKWVPDRSKQTKWRLRSEVR